MLNEILNLNGAQKLNKSEQTSIKGGDIISSPDHCPCGVEYLPFGWRCRGCEPDAPVK